MELAERIINASELEHITSTTKAAIVYGSRKTKPCFEWRFDSLSASESGSSVTASDGDTGESSLTITNIETVRLIAPIEPFKCAYVHIYNAGHITALQLISNEPVNWLGVLDS